MRRLVSVVLVAVAALGVTAARAEVVEEIVAWVNGEIVTKSELESEERILVSEAYRRMTGQELDQYLQEVRKNLLLQLIDNKVLVDRAKMLYDLDKMGNALYEDFRKQQKVENDEEFQRLLAREGMTVEGLKARLVDMYAPEQVIGFEVGGRVAVGDAEVDSFYAEHPDQFVTPGTVSLREIVLLADSAAAKARRRDEAAAVRAEAAAGDFAEVAKRVSEAGTAANGGLLGPLSREDLAGLLREPAFTLPVGEVSAVIEAPYGFHIVRVESRTDDRTQPLEEVRETLRRTLEDRHYTEQRVQFLEKARSEAEWCVKPAYRDRLSIPSPECRGL